MSDRVSEPPVTEAAASAAPVPPGYQSEVRFAVVMYGGVSLAVYIYGVASELFQMASATPRARPGQHVLPEKCTSPQATRDVYTKLSMLAADPQLVARYAAFLRNPDGCEDPFADTAVQRPAVRFCIDVLSGTSAGGLNGLFLAKALANNSDFGALKNLWINEGDFALLLNDGQSLKELDQDLLDPDGVVRPKSVLNSERMYLKLREALASMPAPDPNRCSRFVEELDLFLTVTDIRGSAVTLRLSDSVVKERRHGHSFTLRYREEESRVTNDFCAERDPFLAFAARCTSSFPVAFEPMTLGALETLEGRKFSDRDLDALRRFFPNHSSAELAREKLLTRPFGDGGYLDNKPFTHAVNALTSRWSPLPAERKLIYIEPAPAKPDADPRGVLASPDAIDNALAALIAIPGYEPIREDLLAVLRRNRRIERVDRIVREGERDLDEALDNRIAQALRETRNHANWRELTLSAMRDLYGAAFLPYFRLRVYATTDRLAERIGASWGIESGSDLGYALRGLVRAWREETYYEDRQALERTSLNAFLTDFDYEYRIRRAAFILRKIDQVRRLVQQFPGAGPDTLSEQEEALQRRLSAESVIELGDSVSRSEIAQLLQILDRLKMRVTEVYRTLKAQLTDQETAEADPSMLNELMEVLSRILMPGSGPHDVDNPSGPSTRGLQERVFARASSLYRAAGREMPSGLRDRLKGRIEQIKISISKCLNEERSNLWKVLGSPHLGSDRGPAGTSVGQVQDRVLDSDRGVLLRRFFAGYALHFDSYDQMGYPLHYDTDSGEALPVEIVRISPPDAVALVDESGGRRPKLAGTMLGNFGAFLDRRFRVNDLMWGRLDGAERLVSMLLPAIGSDADEVRRCLIRQAHLSILKTALRTDGYREMAGAFIDTLRKLEQGEENGPPEQQKLMKSLMARLDSGADTSRIRQIAESLLSDDEVLRWMKEDWRVDRSLNRESVLKSGSRATTIFGRILDQSVSARVRGSTAIPRWIIRAGLAAQALLAVSIPGSIARSLFLHPVRVLYALGATLLAASVFLNLVFGNPALYSVALTALGLTLTVHIGVLIIGDLVASTRKVTRRLLILGAAVAAILMAVGAWTVYSQAPGLMCSVPQKPSFCPSS